MRLCALPLETSFHAANHTIPPPPSYEGLPLCSKDKNHSPFHGKKPLMIKWITGRRSYQISQKRFCMVGTRYFASAPNDWYSIWYYNYGRTWSITSLPGLVFRRRRAVFILLTMPPTSLERAALVLWCGWFKHAWNQTGHSTNDRCEALASPKGCFLCFCFRAASIFCVVGFVRWGYFWGDNNFWGWCYVIGLEFVCAYARIVIFSWLWLRKRFLYW